MGCDWSDSEVVNQAHVGGEMGRLVVCGARWIIMRGVGNSAPQCGDSSTLSPSRAAIPNCDILETFLKHKKYNGQIGIP